MPRLLFLLEKSEGRGPSFRLAGVGWVSPPIRGGEELTGEIDWISIGGPCLGWTDLPLDAANVYSDLSKARAWSRDWI